MENKQIYIGASGWTYDDWSGRFYPPEVKGAERLVFYARQFDTVEVNATFYRLPYKTMIDAWNRKLYSSFNLVVKGYRTITHFKKLNNCREPLQAFLDRVLQIQTLKVILWQLPPSLHKDINRLDNFLSQLPKTVRYAVEFRHQSWWDDEVAATLSRHKAVFVAVSHPELPATVFPTADFLYIRFHSPEKPLYQYNYSDQELSAWVSKIKPYLSGRKLYAFFNNDFQAHAPRNAATFKELLQQAGEQS
jgi:uncharacterized protein YecE (DUF72 family)